MKKILMWVADCFLGFLLFSLSSLAFHGQPSPLVNYTDYRKAGSVNVNFQPLPPSPAINPEISGGMDSVIIPLKRAGKLLMVDARIDGQEGNLIFDTGASNIVLNSTYFRNYNRIESTDPNGITGAVGKIYKTIVDSIAISRLTYRSVRVDIADLGHIENRRGVKVLGLFGFNLLRGFEIVIDVRSNKLKLMKIDKKGNRVTNSTGCFKPDYTQSVMDLNNILFVMGNVGGKAIKFCFDTGAEINAVSISSPKVVLNTISVNRRSKIVGVASSSVEVVYGTMSDFSFGNRRLMNMQTVITNLSSLEEAYGTTFGGVLGYDFLEKGIICINLRKNQLGIRFAKEVK